MKKKVGIIIVIWLVLGVIIPLGIMTFINCIINDDIVDYGTRPEDSKALYELLKDDKPYYLLDYPLVSIEDSLNPDGSDMTKDSRIMVRKVTASDSVIDLGNDVKKYSVYINTSENGDIAVSSGTWGIVNRCENVDDWDIIHNNVALWNVDDFIENGNGDIIRDYLANERDAYIRVDRCIIKDYICYPIQVSVYAFDNNEFLRMFYCYNPDDFADCEIIDRDDLLMTTYYDHVLNMVGDKKEWVINYADSLKGKIKYSDEPFYKEHSIMTPFGVVQYVLNSESGYGGVHVEFLDTGQFLLKYFAMIIAVVTSFFFVVITIIVIKERKKNREV